MRFGIILNGGHLPGQARDEVLRGHLAKARAARRAGFHSIWTGQGYLMNIWHSTTLLARVAGEAPGMDFGTILLVPLHHPIELAEQLSTLDVICGGRLTLGLAQGWRDFQFEAFGIAKEERLSRFREVIEVMKKLWSEERVTYRGRHFNLQGIPGAGRPLQIPRMLIAANNEPGVRRAARSYDGWLVSSRTTLPTIQRYGQIYQAEATAAGHTPRIEAWREMYVARDRKAAVATIRPFAERLYQNRAALGHSRELPTADRIDLPFEQILAGRFIIGSPDECAEEVERYQAAGVEHLIMRCQWPGMSADDAIKAIRLFGQQVIPHFS